MVSMTINFDKEKLLQNCETYETILENYNEYCSRYGIKKPKINVFEMDNENALVLIGEIIFDIAKSEYYVNLIESWYWDIDGKREDILRDVKEMAM